MIFIVSHGVVCILDLKHFKLQINISYTVLKMSLEQMFMNRLLIFIKLQFYRSLIDPLPTANANHFVSIFTTPLTKNTFSNVAPLSPKSVISTASTDLQMILELDNDSLSVIMKSDNSEIGEENAVEALEEEHDVAR